VPDGLRGGGKGAPALGGLPGGLPAGLAKPGAGDDLAASLDALATGNPGGFPAMPGEDPSGAAPTDLPAGFGRFRRGKRGDR